ncbi:ABC transporter permease [Anaerocolumna xylanovorans]|uniref:Putative aldouronate transport system permease protein n=1 Tax=Anaerocolumna xylanovorans DSM 12503 TaxID=1121345 RepID=A0A1M7YJV8_9FIRM|nr:ABC transporter permease subunit [Anaerocolumna xylanovorans]SHO52921.1 putative aldouronate transport system permease protein [Anaerocolumna xylanovorans DSM 12503]
MLLKKIKKCKVELKTNIWLYMMFLPVFIWYLLFSYLPMGGMVIAFQKYDIVKGILHSPWVGFRNFKILFDDPYFFRLFRNTLLMNVYGLVFGFPLPIILAIAFNEIRRKKFKKITQTISYLPYFISSVVVMSMVIQFVSTTGLVNVFLNHLGIKSIHFLQEAKYFRTIFISTGIWQGTGFGAIIYMAALAGISNDQYEAATVDGAGKFQKMMYITLPGLAPTIVIMLLINLGSILNVGHERIILLYNPSIYETADVFNSYIYREGILNRRYSYGQAMTIFQNVVGFALVYMANKITRKLDGTTLW